MAPVETRVDDRDPHGIDHRQFVREGVECMILGEVVLAWREWVVRREGRAQGHSERGRREHEPEHYGDSCPHEVETCSTGDAPATKPWPDPTKARYTPVVSWSLARNAPAESSLARVSVTHPDPACRWMKTVDPPSATGRTYPRSWSGVCVGKRRMSGATGTRTAAAATFPLARR